MLKSSFSSDYLLLLPAADYVMRVCCADQSSSVVELLAAATFSMEREKKR
jgi:hypothetical protein